MTTSAVIIASVSILLTSLHHLAFAWPALAFRQDLARPLLINRPDGFAAWWTTMLLLLAAGATRLIFVLRRHRRDDYRGHYQLWQWTLIVLLAASVHSTVDLVGWLGASLDLLVGNRAVLSGANWLRIVLDVGGIILAMRLIAELSRCRPALVALILAAAWIGFSELAHWQIVVVDGPVTATLVIAAPMLGWTCFLVAATLYLRSMYRQIRNIPDAVPIRQRITEWIAERRNGDADFTSEFFDAQDAPRPAVANATTKRAAASKSKPNAKPRPAAKPVRTTAADHSETEEDEAAIDDATTQDRPGWLARLKRRLRKPKPESETESSESTSADTSDQDSGDDDASPDHDGSGTDKPKRRWFGLRAERRIDPGDADADADGDCDSDEELENDAGETAESPPRKKRWFSLRLKPQPAGDETADQEADVTPEETEDDVDEADAVAKKSWFSRLLRRKHADQSDESESQGSDESADSGPSPAASSHRRSSPNAEKPPARSQGPLHTATRDRQSSSAQSAGNPSAGKPRITPAEVAAGEIDPDDIDWESMTKAERRRMRKTLKRAGRAA